MPELTFLFGSTGQRAFVLELPRHPTVLHAAEEGSPGSSGQVGRPNGGIRLDLNPGCTQKHSICDDDIEWWAPALIGCLQHFHIGLQSQFHLLLKPDVAADLLAASMRRWRGYNSEEASCSFTLLMSLGWMKSNKLCPVSSNCDPKWHTSIYSTFYCLCSSCTITLKDTLLCLSNKSATSSYLLCCLFTCSCSLFISSTCSKCIWTVSEIFKWDYKRVFSHGLLVSPTCCLEDMESNFVRSFSLASLLISLSFPHAYRLSQSWKMWSGV